MGRTGETRGPFPGPPSPPYFPTISPTFPHACCPLHPPPPHFQGLEGPVPHPLQCPTPHTPTPSVIKQVWRQSCPGGIPVLNATPNRVKDKRETDDPPDPGRRRHRIAGHIPVHARRATETGQRACPFRRVHDPCSLLWEHGNPLAAVPIGPTGAWEGNGCVIVGGEGGRDCSGRAPLATSPCPFLDPSPSAGGGAPSASDPLVPPLPGPSFRPQTPFLYLGRLCQGGGGSHRGMGRESLEGGDRQKPPPPTAFTSPVTALQPLWNCPGGPPSPSSKALGMG